MANTNPAHIVLRNVRLSYTHLTEPYTPMGGGDPKFSTTVLVPKLDTNNKALMDAAITAAAERGREKFGKTFPVNPKSNVHDGDGVRPSDGQPFGAECKGCWVFTASGKQRPAIVDLNLQPVLNPAEIYSGIYANIGVTFYAYDSNGNKGISTGLENVQKITDGEPLGGRASAEDDFGTATQAAQAYPAPQVQYGVPTAPAVPAYPPQPQYDAQPAYYPGAAYPQQ